MTKLRLATIGAWGHYPQVFAEIDGAAGVEAVGLAKALPDDDLSVFREFSMTRSAPLFDDFRRMLREQKPNVVVVSTRLDLINPIACEVAEAGCHMICEKPLALAHAPLEKLYRTVEKHGVQCIAMLNNRAHPVIQAARQLKIDGRLGEIVLLNARKSYKWGHRPHWFGSREIYGTTIAWVGIHAMDMLQAITDQQFESVAAMHSNRTHPDRPDCQDNAVIIFNLSGGAHATVSIDYLRPSAAATHGDDWLRIVGSRGVVEASLDKHQLLFTSEQESEHLVVLPPPASYYSRFLQQLATRPLEAWPETRRTFELNHVCLSAAAAADSGLVVELEPGPWNDPR